MVELTVDVHEPQEFKAEVMEKAADCKHIDSIDVGPLETGDVVAGDMVFERKESDDYINSTKDRRLSQQSKRMMADFNHTFLVLEGYPFESEHGGGTHPHSLIGQATSLAAKRGIRFIPTDSIEGSAYAVISCIKKVIESEDRSVEEMYNLNMTEVKDVPKDVAMLAQVDGVSVGKAFEIYDKVGGLSHICSKIFAPEFGYKTGPTPDIQEELMEVDDIGEKTSKRIIESFVEE